MKNNSNAMFAAALSAALLIAPGLSSAQTAAAQPAADAKAGAQAAKPVKVAANTSQRAKGTAKSSPAEAALVPDQLAIAERVHVGQMPCELGASVTVSADPKAPGYFHMQGKNFRYRMAPVVSATGTIRLEDPKAGAVWLQMASKSMLMNQKQGTRLADECVSPAQLALAQAAKDQPAAGAPEAAKPAAAAPADQPRPASTN